MLAIVLLVVIGLLLAFIVFTGEREGRRNAAAWAAAMAAAQEELLQVDTEEWTNAIGEELARDGTSPTLEQWRPQPNPFVSTPWFTCIAYWFAATMATWLLVMALIPGIGLGWRWAFPSAPVADVQPESQHVTYGRLAPLRTMALPDASTATCDADRADICQMIHGDGAKDVEILEPTGTPSHGQILNYALSCEHAMVYRLSPGILSSNPGYGGGCTPTQPLWISLLYDGHMRRWGLRATTSRGLENVQ